LLLKSNYYGLVGLAGSYWLLVYQVRCWTKQLEAADEMFVSKELSTNNWWSCKCSLYKLSLNGSEGKFGSKCRWVFWYWCWKFS
jgi:hypothetical protein